MSQAGYVILGSLGLPIFTGAGYGLAHLAGPTGGYLVGFIVCAFLIGQLIDLKEGAVWKIAVFIFGLASIYACNNRIASLERMEYCAIAADGYENINTHV